VADATQHDLVFSVAQTVHRLGARGVIGTAFGQLDAAGGQERTSAVRSRLAVHVGVVVADGVESDERSAGAAGPGLQIAVEHLLPRGGMHLRCFGQDTIEIEQARSHHPWQTNHAGGTRTCTFFSSRGRRAVSGTGGAGHVVALVSRQDMR